MDDDPADGLVQQRFSELRRREDQPRGAVEIDSHKLALNDQLLLRHERCAAYQQCRSQMQPRGRKPPARHGHGSRAATRVRIVAGRAAFASAHAPRSLPMDLLKL